MDTSRIEALTPIQTSTLAPISSAPLTRDLNTRANNWDSIVSRVTSLTQPGLHQATEPSKQIQHLSGLLKLQVDVSRYQLRVELISKVSESAVASIRKLQQNQ